MINPQGQRICRCGHPQLDHDMWGEGSCLLCGCWSFELDREVSDDEYLMYYCLTQPQDPNERKALQEAYTQFMDSLHKEKDGTS